jgi:hypothetical protein
MFSRRFWPFGTPPVSDADPQVASLPSESDVQAMAREADEAKQTEDEQQPDLGLPFTVTLQSMSGSSFQIIAQPRHCLNELYTRAASELGKGSHELRIIRGAQLLGVDMLGTTLEDLGIGDGEVLNLMMHSCVRIDNPGASKYNKNYVCEVHSVEEVDWDKLEVKFEVRGDMSLGPIQLPSDSKLSWTQTHGSFMNRVRSERQDIQTIAAKKHLKGSLIFAGVPTTGEVEFTYGSSGYKSLKVNLSDVEHILQEPS